MKFQETPLSGNYVLNLDLKEDKRGFFARFFCKNDFKRHGLNTKWVQINTSMNHEVGTLRGLHFQNPPQSEVKLVRCLKGAIWDVVVDIRKDSRSFGKWFGTKLSETNRTMMYVPKGFAHGFVSLETDSEILYMVSDFYAPEAEGTLIWNDLDVGIQWPIEPQVLSEKDKQGKLLRDINPVKLD